MPSLQKLREKVLHDQRCTTVRSRMRWFRRRRLSFLLSTGAYECAGSVGEGSHFCYLQVPTNALRRRRLSFLLSTGAYGLSKVPTKFRRRLSIYRCLRMRWFRRRRLSFLLSTGAYECAGSVGEGSHFCYLQVPTNALVPSEKALIFVIYRCLRMRWFRRRRLSFLLSTGAYECAGSVGEGSHFCYLQVPTGKYSLAKKGLIEQFMVLYRMMYY